MVRILLVEDDKTIALGLEYSLKQEGFDATVCHTVQSALQTVKNSEFQLILLDIGLPDGNGYDAYQSIKKMQDIPVIFLTACDDEVNVVMGLDMGADDYITKPFRLKELISRIKNVLRRCGKNTEEKSLLTFGNIQINTAQAKVYRDGEMIVLTALEYRLLLKFFENPGCALSRNQLLEGIWDIGGEFVNDNTLTVYIKRLREKIEDNPQSPQMIQTVRGIGYRLGD